MPVDEVVGPPGERICSLPLRRPEVPLRLLIAVLPLLAACISHDEFVSEDVRITCEWYARCDMLGSLGFEDQDDCVAEATAWQAADPESCEVYDAGAAADCLEAKAAYTCGPETEQYPVACDEVCTGAAG